MQPVERAEGEARPRTGFPRTWLPLAGFVLLVALGYANSLDVPFLFDDPFLSPDEPDVELDYSSRPLVWASFDLNRALSGRDTTSYHVVNVLVHLACGLLLFGILRRTLALAAGSWSARTREALAFLTTALWLVHPLQTESVTYLSQRAESLGALFTLGVLYAFLRARASPRPARWYGLAWLSLALGFLTKETIATAPLLVLLYEVVFFAHGPLEALRRNALLYAGLGLVALGFAAVLIVPLLAREGGSAGFKLREFGALDYLRTQPGVILHYLRLVFWPHPLCLDYAWPIAQGARDWLPQSAVILALLAATLVGLARRSWCGYAGAFFFVVLLPSSSIVPIRDPAVEHRMYLPLAAVLALVVIGLHALLARSPGRAPRLAALAALAALVALLARTIQRNQDYRSAEGLWRQTVTLAPHNARAHGNLGSILAGAGSTEEAMKELMRGFELAPEDGPILLNLGKAHARQGDLERAIWFLRRGVARTKDARGLGSLGMALFDKGDFTGAVLYFREALALAPDDPGAHFRLASALAELGRVDEALQGYARALELAPEFQECRINLAAYLVSLERLDEALAQSLAALALQPNSGLELHNHAQLLATLGRADEALEFLRQACRAEPDVPEFHSALAELALSQPEPAPALRREALDALRALIRLAPEATEPRAALAQAIAQWEGASMNERREALAEAERAAALAGEPRPDLLAILALARAALGENAGALAALDQALGLPATAAQPAFEAELRALRADLERRAAD